ncbi:MAG TPA: hypothetical protein VHK04_05010, partial [Castellaniella sp.]|nr:hypothetical protein [Castellaniella sp.]
QHTPNSANSRHHRQKDANIYATSGNAERVDERRTTGGKFIQTGSIHASPFLLNKSTSTNK